ncbi:YceI family protein [Subsaxibacter sp. CAU 1640]|uniref:YceI family protein n=1 Tax=Subsaxibacter sp. CAU 1640 TaxID=2933271 RepID=UPI002006B4C9|nr:YceI family protein [Subsaxibacter sp. CAU 1640]MCK7590104.1 YceI family protein [Subsaxibacter sp. CAU 1640]
MKYLFIVFLLISFSGLSQEKYLTKTGTVNFGASVPSFEEVAAQNNSVTAIINVKTGEFAALALVKAFRFKNALMEEHFNENYAESEKFPKATFRGTIEKFSLENLTSSKTAFKLNGELTFHGVTKKLDDCTVSISKTDKGLVMEGSFEALASDYGIEIPKIVSNKIAQDIVVSFRFELTN